MASLLNDKVPVTVKQALRGGGVRDITIPMTRSWCPAIGNMQVEDDRGYGWPMKAINLNPQKWKRSTMLTWALLAMISSSKELYHNVDQIVGGRSYKTLSGHLLTYIHHNLMKHCDSAIVKKSPFKSNMSQGALCSVVEDYFPLSSAQLSGGPINYFMFGFCFFQKMFGANFFPRLVW